MKRILCLFGWHKWRESVWLLPDKSQGSVAFFVIGAIQVRRRRCRKCGIDQEYCADKWIPLTREHAGIGTVYEPPRHINCHCDLMEGKVSKGGVNEWPPKTPRPEHPPKGQGPLTREHAEIGTVYEPPRHINCHCDLTEGKVNKGGVNEWPPKTPRPEHPPKGQGPQ